MKNKKKWIRFRHKVVHAVVRPFFALAAGAKYHARVERFKQEGKRNWLIVSNHQTDFDQFIVGLAFHQPVYYVAMEDVFSNGWLSRLIEWLVAPIPIMKAATDIKAIRTCMQVAKEGGSIALFPEGNRTYSGKNCYIKPSVASLAKHLGLPIAVFHIEGGYGVKPRWADNTRKGPLKAGVVRIIEPEEYGSMSKEELYDLLCGALDVDETKNPHRYESKRPAEHLERALYVCPHCGITTLKTDHDLVTCTRCGLRYRLGTDGRFTAENGTPAFGTVADWYAHQEAFIRSLDLTPYAETPAFTEKADLTEVIVYKKKQKLGKDLVTRVYADRLTVGDRTFPFADVTAMACIAGHKLNVFYDGHVYQLKGDASFNALKYCNFYYHAKFIEENHENGEFQFLGL